MNYIRKIRKAIDLLERHRGEITSVILSFAVLSLLLNLGFTLFLFAVLIVHEGGHAWALAKKSIGVKRVYFFIIGGGVLPERQFKSCDEAAFVAIMGSIFTIVPIVALSIAWYVLNIKLLAYMVIFLSAVTVFNLLPYVFLDGGIVRDSIQRSSDLGQIMFLIPEIIMTAFLVFKSKVIVLVLILMVVDTWRKRKRSELKISQEQNVEPEVMTRLTTNEIRSYYATYFAIVLICIILSLALELNGFDLDLSLNFDNIISELYI